MTFAFPIALTLTALALPIVALYILKVRLRRVPVSTNLFWKQIYDEKPPRALWQNLRHLSSLLLQLLMLLLLVLAIADPYFSWQMLQARRIVVIIDNSASMSATDISPSRFKAAQAEALAIVDGLRFHDEMAVIVANSNPEVLVGMTDHVPTLRDAIDSVHVRDTSTQLKTAIQIGRQLLGQHPHGRIIVLTDGAVDENESNTSSTDSIVEGSSNPAAADHVGAEVVDRRGMQTSPNAIPGGSLISAEFKLFGTDVGNVGITQLQVRRSLIDPLGYEILTSVRNASHNSAKCRLELTLDDIPIDVVPLSLAPEELWTRSFEKTSLAGGRLNARLTMFSLNGVDSNAVESDTAYPDGHRGDVDMLEKDNSAWALLPERKTQNVLVVSSNNLFLQKVFEANPLVEVTARNDFPAAGEWPKDSIIVLHGQVPAVLPDGNVFVVDPTGLCDLWDGNVAMENPIVTDQDAASPLMNHIRLENVVVPEVHRLDFKLPVHSLARTVEGAVIYGEVQRPNGKCLVLSINLDRSDLAFRTAFPILVSNALNWFAGTSGELQPAIESGSVISVPIAKYNEKPDDFRLVSPSGTASRIAVSLGQDFQSSPLNVEELPVKAIESTSESGTVSESAIGGFQTVNVGPLNEIGVWSIVDGRSSNQVSDMDSSSGFQIDDVLAEVAVNLTSDRETDLRPLETIQASNYSGTVIAGWFGRPFWFYLICAALVLTCVEWWLYQRRFIA